QRVVGLAEPVHAGGLLEHGVSGPVGGQAHGVLELGVGDDDRVGARPVPAGLDLLEQLGGALVERLAVRFVGHAEGAVPGDVVVVGGVAEVGVGGVRGAQHPVHRGERPLVAGVVGLGFGHAEAGVVDERGVGDRVVVLGGADDVDDRLGVGQVVLVDGEASDDLAGLEEVAGALGVVVGVGAAEPDLQAFGAEERLGGGPHRHAHGLGLDDRLHEDALPDVGVVLDRDPVV